VIAPAGFLAAAIDENVIAGGAMGRRALHQFGNLLPRSATGLVDSGMGKTIVSGMSPGAGGTPPGPIALEGPRPEALTELFGTLERPDADFPIVTP